MRSSKLGVLTVSQQKEIRTVAFEKQFGSFYGLTTMEEADKFLKTPKPEGFDDGRYKSLYDRAEKIVKIEKGHAKWQTPENHG